MQALPELTTIKLSSVILCVTWDFLFHQVAGHQELLLPLNCCTPSCFHGRILAMYILPKNNQKQEHF